MACCNKYDYYFGHCVPYYVFRRLDLLPSSGKKDSYSYLSPISFAEYRFRLELLSMSRDGD
jgi:hypothetical protein